MLGKGTVKSDAAYFCILELSSAFVLSAAHNVLFFVLDIKLITTSFAQFFFTFAFLRVIQFANFIPTTQFVEKEMLLAAGGKFLEVIVGSFANSHNRTGELFMVRCFDFAFAGALLLYYSTWHTEKILSKNDCWLIAPLAVFVSISWFEPGQIEFTYISFFASSILPFFRALSFILLRKAMESSGKNGHHNAFMLEYTRLVTIFLALPAVFSYFGSNVEVTASWESIDYVLMTLSFVFMICNLYSQLWLTLSLSPQDYLVFESSRNLLGSCSQWIIQNMAYPNLISFGAKIVSFASLFRVWDIMHTIACEHPMMAVLSKAFQESHCALCFQALASEGCEESYAFTCDDCVQVSYCSMKCQRIDWRTVHQQECEILRSQKRKPFMTTTMRLCLRVLLNVTKDSEKPNSKGTILNDLETNYEEFRSSSSHNEFISDIMAVVRTAGHNFFSTETLSNEKMFGVICSVLCNSFSIIDEVKVEAIGTGLYINLANHNHACSSTSHIVFNGNEAILRSKSNVRCESMTISYVSRMLPTAARRKAIHDVHFLTCKCEMCLNEDIDLIALASRCPNPNCTGYVKGCRCQLCGKNSLRSEEELESLFKNNTDNEDGNLKNEFFKLSLLREDYGKILADCNVAILQLDEQIAYCASNLPDESLPENLAAIAVRGCEHFIERLHLGAPEVTRRLYIACKCLFRKATIVESALVRQAYQSSCMSHGQSHYITNFLWKCVEKVT